jgi:hypothetical protein
MKKCLRFLLPGLFFLALVSQGCKPLIALYDQNAYTNATSVKVDVLNLIGKATESFASHQAEAEAVNVKVEKAYEYEKHRLKNGITVKMWDILKDPSRNLYGGVIKRWRAESTLNAGFVSEIKLQIAEGFDLIAELESNKIKEDDLRVKKFLGTSN